RQRQRPTDRFAAQQVGEKARLAGLRRRQHATHDGHVGRLAPAATGPPEAGWPRCKVGTTPVRKQPGCITREARGPMANEPVQDTDPTIGRLVSDASRDVSSLLRNEIQLAKSELRLSAKAGGVGIAMFAAAAFFAVMALIMLSVAFAYFLNW